MTNITVTSNGARPALPTVPGQGPIRIPTGGKIRAGIKVLTKKAAENPNAREIYERGALGHRPGGAHRRYHAVAGKRRRRDGDSQRRPRSANARRPVTSR